MYTWTGCTSEGAKFQFILKLTQIQSNLNCLLRKSYQTRFTAQSHTKVKKSHTYI